MLKKDNNGSIQLFELWQYIGYLQRLLDREGIAYNAMKGRTDSSFHAGEITTEHAKLLFSVFKGRNDVYSKKIWNSIIDKRCGQHKSERLFELRPDAAGTGSYASRRTWQSDRTAVTG